MNRHQFEQAAKHFRAGRLTLTDFSAQVFPEQHPDKSVEPVQDVDLAVNSLPLRPANAHKGDFGRVLMIGGSSSMPGAIGLAGMAALRSGSGLVVVACPTNVAATVASFCPCYMTLGYNRANPLGGELEEYLQWADVVALGPGLGTEESTVELVTRLYQSLAQPMVVDADGLNCLAIAGVNLGEHDGIRVLTPHPGEFRRLVDDVPRNRSEMESAAKELASAQQFTVVLKGQNTLVTDGVNSAHNSTGNAGMATGGSGDVLTGMIASLIGQGMDAFSASRSACHFHGLAGDLAAEKLGQISLISSDLMDFLPKAFKAMGDSSSS